MTNPSIEVQKFGQSIWYDNISRNLVSSGELARLIEEDGVLGVTSNPAIFEKAIGGSSDYDASIEQLVGQGVGSAVTLFEHLAIADIQLGTDALRGVYDATGRVDGYVSLEVSPYLADDCEGTILEARRLWKAVDRENLMIKVPATAAGVPAIAQLIGEGINVNVTLLFSVEAYRAVADAYLDGLEKLAEGGGDVSRVASVASFFVSRIDAMADAQLAQLLENERDPARRATLEGLRSKVAIANAVMAYAHYDELTASERWTALEARGAMPQRVLWASTGTKSPDLPKTLYVDELIGRDTVNTVPTATLEAFRQTGTVKDALGADKQASIANARAILSDLETVGISLKEITNELLPKGCQLFSDAFDTLLAAVASKREDVLGSRLARLDAKLGDCGEAVENALDHWRSSGYVRKLWDRDAALWSGGDEAQWLGWLDVVAGWRDNLAVLEQMASRVQAEDIAHVVVMGMGGSSLCPDVLSRTFGPAAKHPELLVLDSTVPSQIAAISEQIDLAKTLFIVPSKSGGTIEPNSFKAYFWDRVESSLGTGEAARRFIAITDPGTALDKLAQRENFSSIAYGIPSIGGRFSALSAFGMIPAASLGIDPADFLARTQLMVDSCSRSVPPARNPGVELGVILGTLAQQGRDKLTLVTSPAIGSLGAWLEQLIAESTGKQDRGIVPVAGEQLASPDHYGDDRLFVQLRLATDPCPEHDAGIAALEAAGHPVVRIDLADKRDLGQEFYCWQIATAVAGAILQINAFDQPDVEAAKIAALELMKTYEENGSLPVQSPVFEADGVLLFADPRNAKAIRGDDLETLLKAHLDRIGRGDYFAINAYLEMNDSHDAPLQEIRHAVRDHYQIATTLGYGPRFLHSTGQLHKGGPNRGVFLQLTSDDAEDLAIPGQNYTFGVLKSAQAQGDLAVLSQRDRRVVRVHLGADVRSGLEQLAAMVRRVLTD
ncbi:MAG: bifunctional transaldolase/phosoglucose isomerase [Deltaproteobacteria bacterium]|nr:bifunctional transaldolase/phosoglucose isomerase [Deltaproteobacteria bacterium]